MLGVRDVAEDRSRLARLVPPVLSTRLLVVPILLLLVWGGGYLILPQPDATVLGIYGFTLVWVAANVRWVLLGLEQAVPVALARVAGEALVLLTVFLLVRGPADLATVPLAQFTGDALAALALLWWLRRSGVGLPFRLDRPIVEPLFRRSSQLMWNAVLGLMIFNADLLLLRVFRDSATVGYYAVAYTLVSFILNLGIAYSLSLLPALTRSWPQPAERQSLYDASAAHVMAAAFPIAAGGALLAPAIIGLFFGERYAPSAWALTLLLGSIPVAAMRNVPQAALIAGGRQELVLRTTAICAVVNLGLNLALIPHWGMTGAALATILTEAVRTSVTIALAARVGCSTGGLVRAWRPLLATGVMSAAILAIGRDQLWLPLSAGIVVYALALVVIGGIRRNERGRPVLTV